jgi:hypothetical protein
MCAVIQALCFVPLIVASLRSSFPIVAAFFVISLYWATGQAGGTAWNAWVEDLVPERVRAKFFACRTRYVQFGVLAGFIVGGVALQIGHRENFGLMPFALLFIGAVVSRLVSASYLDSQSDAQARPKCESINPWSDFYKIVTKSGHSRIILYVLAAQLGCQISGPYFTPYMLGHLKLSYVHYVTLICIAYIARVFVAPMWGRVVGKIGVNRLLWISGLAIVPLPALWNISDSFTYLAILQIYSGAVWAAYELANLLLILGSIPAAKKISILTIYNLVNALALVGGSFIGGYLLTVMGGGRQAYLLLFLASTVARAVALLILVKMPVRLPVFIRLFVRQKKEVSLGPSIAPPIAQKRPVLKPLAAAPRVHGSHKPVPKPVFLRGVNVGSKEGEANWGEDSVVLKAKRV